MDQDIKVKDYRFIKNRILLQFIKRECQKELALHDNSCTFKVKLTNFAINENNIKEIYTYTRFINEPTHYRGIGELILQIEIENIQQKQDVFNFLNTNKSLKFHLINRIRKFPKPFTKYVRYVTFDILIKYFELDDIKLKRDDLIFNCILPGMPIDDIYYIIERNSGNEIERTLIEFNNGRYPMAVKPQVSKNNFISFFTNLFFSSTKHRKGNKYNRFDHPELN